MSDVPNPPEYGLTMGEMMQLEQFHKAMIVARDDWWWRGLNLDSGQRQINRIRAELMERAPTPVGEGVRALFAEGKAHRPLPTPPGYEKTDQAPTSGEKTMQQLPNTDAKNFRFGFWVMDPMVQEFLREPGEGTTDNIYRAHIWDLEELKEFAGAGDSYVEYLKKCIYIPALPLTGYPDGAFKEMLDVVEYVSERLGAVLQEEAKAAARTAHTRRHVKA